MTSPSQRQVNVDQMYRKIDQDPSVEWLEHLPLPRGPEVSVCEVRCGHGLRPARMKQARCWTVVGLDPSEKAIAAEANRALKQKNWLAIPGFLSTRQIYNLYHQVYGILSYKFYLPAIFSWHSCYVSTDHHLQHHAARAYNDGPEELVASTLLQRRNVAAR